MENVKNFNQIRIDKTNIISLEKGKLPPQVIDLEEAVLKLLQHAHADHFELITLFYGADVTRMTVDAIADSIRKKFPEQDIEVQEGGQPHYHFIISIE